jgi:hypothetical protein
MWDCFCIVANVSHISVPHPRGPVIDVCFRGGMIAPLLGGALLMMDRSIPVYASILTFAIAGFCVLMLREGEGDSGRSK